jgi:excisionase family DNA binding protein
MSTALAGCTEATLDPDTPAARALARTYAFRARTACAHCGNHRATDWRGDGITCTGCGAWSPPDSRVARRRQIGAQGPGGEGPQRRSAMFDSTPIPAGRVTDRLLRVDEAADLLSVAPPTLYQWAYQRRIPVVKLLGRALRFKESDLQKLIAEGIRPPLGRRRP